MEISFQLPSRFLEWRGPNLSQALGVLMNFSIGVCPGHSRNGEIPDLLLKKIRILFERRK